MPNRESIEHDYMALTVTVKGLVAQVLFPLTLLVRRRTLSTGQILWVNNRLPSWYQQPGFSFYDHETTSEDQQLPGRGGVELPPYKVG